MMQSVSVRTEKRLVNAAPVAFVPEGSGLRQDHSALPPVVYVAAPGSAASRIPVWLVHPPRNVRAEGHDGVDMVISGRTRQILGLDDRGAGEAVTTVPDHCEVAVRPKRVEQLEDDLTVNVSPSVPVQGAEWVLVSNLEASASVALMRIIVDPTLKGATARLSASQRILLDVENTIYVSPLLLAAWRRPLAIEQGRGRRWRAAAKSTARGSVEAASRVSVGTRSAAVRVAGAPATEQEGRVASFPERLLQFLAVEAGDEVVVEWGPRWSIVIAAPLPPETVREDDARSEAVDHAGSYRTGASRPHSRVALLPTVVRNELGIAGEVVVTVRRDGLRQLRKRLEGLALPAAGVTFAGLTVPDLPPEAVVGPVVVLVAFGVLSNRIGSAGTSAGIGKWRS